MEFSVRVAGTVTQTGMDVPNRLSQHNGESRKWDHSELKISWAAPGAGFPLRSQQHPGELHHREVVRDRKVERFLGDRLRPFT